MQLRTTIGTLGAVTAAAALLGAASAMASLEPIGTVAVANAAGGEGIAAS